MRVASHLRAVLAIAGIAGCSHPATSAGTEARSTGVVASVPAVVATAPPRKPACGGAWRNVTTTLVDLRADDAGATICARQLSGTTTECVHLEFASGAFAVIAQPPAAVVAPAPDTTKLNLPPAELAAIDEHGYAIDASPDGTTFLAPLPVENVVGVFDAAGKRTRTIKPTTPDAKCVGPAYFIGATIYATARACDELDLYAKHAFLFGGKTMRVEVPEILGGGETRFALDPPLWAVAALKPYRVVLVDGSAAKITRTTPLPQFDGADPMADSDESQPEAPLGLGLTVFGTMPLAVSPIVRSGDSLVAVSSRGIARIPPKGAPTIWRFPSCDP